MRERCHRRKETTDKSNPTVYSYCRVSINATGCLAWEESKLGCSEEEGVLEPEWISNDMEKSTTYRSTSIDHGSPD
jgi:hypothetical protein